MSSSEVPQWQGLVRVIPKTTPDVAAKNDEEEDDDEDEMEIPKTLESPMVMEYWWTLTRCQTGFHKGCFMVDSVMPASY